MSSLWKDVKFAARMLTRSPGFAIVAIVTLALGIGANTALFSVIHAILLRPLPFDEPERLVLIQESSKRLDKMSVAYPNFEDWRKQANSFEQMAAHMLDDFNLTGTDMPERLLATRVSSSLFPMLGVETAVGRVFLDEEDQVGAEQVVVLSHGFWLRRFGGSADVIGETIFLDGSSYVVIGVAPEGFRYPLSGWVPDIYLTIGNSTEPYRTSRDQHPGTRVTARLAPGVSLERARTELIGIARGLEMEYPGTNTGLSVHLESLREVQVKEIRPALIVLTAAAVLVLLIACANVANLLLARGSARSREMSVRTALGAGRARLLRQLLSESVLLSLSGAALGVVMAIWGVKFLSHIMPERLAPTYGQIEIESTVLAFTLFLSVATGLVFGVVPALLLSKPKLGETLKEGGRGGTVGKGRQGFRNTLVDAESRVELYMPHPQYPPISMVLFIKTDAPADTMASAVLKEVLELDPDQPVHNIRTVESRLGDRLVPHRLLLSLISVFGTIALLLATGGIYALMAYMVSQRTHEFGIRMAMGAQARDVLGLVLGNGMRLTVLGLGAGLLAALSVTPLLANQLFGVSPRDPWTFAAIPTLLMVFAGVASLVPARRATRVAPTVALRHE